MNIENKEISEATRKYKKYNDIRQYENFLRSIHFNTTIRALMNEVHEAIEITSWEVAENVYKTLRYGKEGLAVDEEREFSFFEIAKILFEKKINFEKMKQNFWDSIAVIIIDAPNV